MLEQQVRRDEKRCPEMFSTCPDCKFLIKPRVLITDLLRSITGYRSAEERSSEGLAKSFIPVGIFIGVVIGITIIWQVLRWIERRLERRAQALPQSEPLAPSDYENAAFGYKSELDAQEKAPAELGGGCDSPAELQGSSCSFSDTSQGGGHD
jgi:hypothetical protein